MGRLDAINNDFNRQYRQEVNGPVGLGSGGTTILTLSSVTLLAGQTAFIDAQWILDTASIFAGVALQWEIRRNGSRITPTNLRTNSVGADGYAIGAFTCDDSPGAGTYTYTIWVAGIAGSQAAMSISLSINEHRR